MLDELEKKFGVKFVGLFTIFIVIENAGLIINY